jgi:hypothetical protein
LRREIAEKLHNEEMMPDDGSSGSSSDESEFLLEQLAEEQRRQEELDDLSTEGEIGSDIENTDKGNQRREIKRRTVYGDPKLLPKSIFPGRLLAKGKHLVTKVPDFSSSKPDDAKTDGSVPEHHHRHFHNKETNNTTGNSTANANNSNPGNNSSANANNSNPPLNRSTPSLQTTGSTLRQPGTTCSTTSGLEASQAVFPGQVPASEIDIPADPRVISASEIATMYHGLEEKDRRRMIKKLDNKLARFGKAVGMNFQEFNIKAEAILKSRFGDPNDKFGQNGISSGLNAEGGIDAIKQGLGGETLERHGLSTLLLVYEILTSLREMIQHLLN